VPLVRPGLSSPAPSGVLTDGKGAFLVTDVAPGEYFLVAKDLSRRQPGQFEPHVALLRTYYPNSTQVASARPVTVRSGADLGGLEIRMTCLPWSPTSSKSGNSRRRLVAARRLLPGGRIRSSLDLGDAPKPRSL
jgi:hypothetical protein